MFTRRFFIAGIFLIVSITTLAQSDSLRNNKNEISVDASPFFQQFIFIANQFSPSSSAYPYYLMYRRHIDKWAIRAAVGGTISKDKRTESDSTVIIRKDNQLEYRVGIERKTNFAKRWQFYYGLDFFSANLYSYDDENYQNGGQSVGSEHIINHYGGAPFLGFRFRLKKQFSLSVESNYRIYYYYRIDKRLYTPDASQNTRETREGYETEFTPPIHIFVNYRF